MANVTQFQTTQGKPHDPLAEIQRMGSERWLCLQDGQQGPSLSDTQVVGEAAAQ